jgi:F-type H+-transporting ATPase subunit a
MRNRPQFLTLILALTGMLFFSANLFASEEAAHAEEQHEAFKPGQFIIDHVTDKYDWHVFGPHDGGFSIPLPVILYSKANGLDIFLSSKFHHGHEAHNGYTLNHEGHIEREDKADFYDFSITKAVAGILITCALILLIFVSVAKAYEKRAGKAPKGFQSLIEPLIIFVRDDIAKQSIGDKHYRRFLPFLLTLFFFIWISNFIGLIPSFPGVMGNISVAFAMALIVLVITLFIGNKHYWQHILWMPGVPAWVKICLLTPIEIIGVIQRPFVLMIRIFANIVAGHIVILAFICLIFVFSEKGDAGGWGFSPVSLIFALFMNSMELLVAFLQAFVFTLLTSMYIGSCLEEPHHAEHH